MPQQKALEKIRDGENVAILGSGGTGKSYTVNQFKDSTTVVAAPTGISALNVGGSTLHRLFALPLGICQRQHIDNKLSQVGELFGNESPTTKLVIDEISMVRRDQFDLVNAKLQRVRKNKLPFGGLQVVVVGDFFQLPPIVTSTDSMLFYEKFNSPFCFSSKAWNFNVIEFDKVFRQENERDVKILNSIRRKDKWHVRAIEVINKETKPYDIKGDSTVLCSLKKDANTINLRKYKEIEGIEKSLYGIKTGVFPKDELRVEEVIKLKIGTKVIICANDIKNQEYANGETGYVTKIGYNSVDVELDRGIIVSVGAHTWEHKEYVNRDGLLEHVVKGTFTQVPLRMGYAITVHSSQGMTLENVALDISGKCFTSGMAYVALSRCKSIKNISLVGEKLQGEDVRVDKRVLEFYSKEFHSKEFHSKENVKTTA